MPKSFAYSERQVLTWARTQSPPVEGDVRAILLYLYARYLTFKGVARTLRMTSLTVANMYHRHTTFEELTNLYEDRCLERMKEKAKATKIGSFQEFMLGTTKWSMKRIAEYLDLTDITVKNGMKAWLRRKE
jgi:hypothetical protein